MNMLERAVQGLMGEHGCARACVGFRKAHWHPQNECARQVHPQVGPQQVRWELCVRNSEGIWGHMW